MPLVVQRRWIIPVLIFGLLLAVPAHGQTLLGDAGGVRTSLGSAGVTLSVNDSENLLGNTTGGIKTGATMQGVTTATLQADTTHIFGVAGTFNVSALQIHGANLSPGYLGTLQGANGNESDNATRLWELWYDLAIGGSGADIKLGQQSLDQDFIVSGNSNLFVNTAAGWPLVPTADLYAGGPAYPLSSLGGRVKVAAGAVTVLAGVFDDNPGGGVFAHDPQSADAGGTRFNLGTGALFISEVQYATSAAQTGMPGIYKLGVYYDTGSFPNQEFDTAGQRLSSPASNGVPAAVRGGNFAGYAVVDQPVMKFSDSSTANLFARILAGPSTQNLVTFSFNGGVTVTAPLPFRPNDSAGIDIDLGHVTNHNSAAIAGGDETLVELTYQAQATPWLALQPDLQFVHHPGAGAADPADPDHVLRDEFVAGMRANLAF